jgi:hypothetical protein
MWRGIAAIGASLLEPLVIEWHSMRGLIVELRARGILVSHWNVTSGATSA